MEADSNSDSKAPPSVIPNGGRPIFTITPVPIGPAASTDASPAEISVVIGLQGTDESPKLHSTGMRSRDSRESLIPDEHAERWWHILAQVCIPFIIAGLGMVGAGLILDLVKDWKVFKKVPEFLVLVTPLLGLKGNLEMTLASRLSTHSNLGHMDTPQTQWHICFGNLCLTQVQAIVVGFLASVVAVVMGAAFDGRFVLNNALLLCACSILTAAITSCVLGVLMVSVVIFCKKFHLNPDNVLTPIAASLGDVTTLGLLSWLASMLYEEVEYKPWLSPSIIVVYICVTPLWVWISYRNEYTRKILYTGWLPVICAMILSSGGGMLLDMAEHRFPRIALYQPVINGVGGNLVSVQASRISTSLHKYCVPGILPETKNGPAKVWLSPWSIFTKQGVHSVSARVLLAIVVPGHILFCLASYSLSGSQDDDQLSPLFFLVYLTAATIQVGLLLCVAHVMILWFWTRKIDPDTSTIPYLTALGDLIGTGFLFLAFQILYTKS